MAILENEPEPRIFDAIFDPKRSLEVRKPVLIGPKDQLVRRALRKGGSAAEQAGGQAEDGQAEPA